MGDPGVIIGYSFWGFLGPGIIDTPDGGRAHRGTLIDGLTARGHRVLFLQANRDLDEVGDDLTAHYTWQPGHPRVDVLFLEWRWPIPGRNTSPCGTPGHTCDLHRQTDLLDHYTHRQGLPTVIWDKDRQLATDHPLRRAPHVTVCEPALHSRPGATRLLFPVADTDLDTADPATLAEAVRDVPLVYVGNQYDRDHAFDTYFAPAAAHHQHLVAGKWPHVDRWPHVRFTGRIAFTEVRQLHQRALSTVLLLPHRYATTGQFTQRLFEAVLAGCLPLTPADIRSAPQVVPPQLLVRNGSAVTAAISTLSQIAGTAAHAQLIGQCLRRLEPFRLSHQLDVLDAVFDRATARRRPAPPRAG